MRQEVSIPLQPNRTTQHGKQTNKQKTDQEKKIDVAIVICRLAAQTGYWLSNEHWKHELVQGT